MGPILFIQCIKLTSISAVVKDRDSTNSLYCWLTQDTLPVTSYKVPAVYIPRFQFGRSWATTIWLSIHVDIIPHLFLVFKSGTWRQHTDQPAKFLTEVYCRWDEMHVVWVQINSEWYDMMMNIDGVISFIP